MLLGEYHHSLDAKNRVSIPAKFRDELGERFIIVRNIRKSCLCVYSAEEWAKYVEKCKQMPVKVVEKAFEFYITTDPTVVPEEKLIEFTGSLEEGKNSTTYYLVVRMKETAGNEFQNKVYNGIGITVHATQKGDSVE